MKTLIILVCLLIGTPAWATTLTGEFAGNVSFIYGTVDGSFTYESTASPSAYNVRGLGSNVTYALTSWEINVQNTFASIPSPYLVNFPSTISFSNILAENTAEFCIGICIFSSQSYESLRFYSGEYFLQLEFKIPSVGPFILTPPDTLEEWGVLDDARNIQTTGGGASSFESPLVVSLLTSGAITGLSSAPSARVPEAVPEPSTWLLLAGGLTGVLGYRLFGGRTHG